MADIRFNCPSCINRLAIDPVGEGREIVCPHCGRKQMVPRHAAMLLRANKKLQGLVKQVLQHEMYDYEAVGETRDYLRGLGYRPCHGDDAHDYSAFHRLRMIVDINRRFFQQRERWKMDTDRDALDIFPARELLRVEDRDNPRNWGQRWDAAFAPFRGATRASSGRMVALINHPGWKLLSAFGLPWPPFDVDSGMDFESVERGDAKSLGLIAAGEQISLQKAPDVPFVTIEDERITEHLKRFPFELEAAEEDTDADESE